MIARGLRPRSTVSAALVRVALALQRREQRPRALELRLDLAHVELGDQAGVGALTLQLERAGAEVERPLGRRDLLVERTHA